MDLKMFSISKPPSPRSEVAVMIKKVCLKSNVGLVELWVNIVPDIKSVETAPDQISFNADSQAHRVLGNALPRRQNKSPPSPYQLETCLLANILPFEEKWSEKATIFLKSVLYKQMNGIVVDVLMPDRIILIDIPLITTFLSRGRMAKKIQIGHFKRLVMSSLDSPKGQPSTPCSISPVLTNGGCAQEAPGQYLYLELQPGLFENIEVTRVNDPLSLFCKLSIFSKELKKLSKQMQLHYNGRSAPGLGRPWARGSPCATRGVDGTWQRSQLNEDTADNTGCVEVLHVDHGETQRISTSDVLHLHESFVRVPVMTYHCAMDGVRGTTWSKDQMDVLKSLMRNAVVARFECYDAEKDMYDVTLFGVEADCINAAESTVLANLGHAGKDFSAEDCSSPLGRDNTEKSFSTKGDVTNRFLRCSVSPKSANPPAMRRTDNDKCVDKKCWPNPSTLRRENACSIAEVKNPLQSVCNLITEIMVSQSVNPLEAVPGTLVTPENQLNGSHPPHPSPSSSANRSMLEIPVDNCKMQKQTVTEPMVRTVQQNEVWSRNGQQAGVEQRASGASVRGASVAAGMPVNPPVEPINAYQNATLADLPLRILEQGSTSAVHISHFSSPTSFFVQLQQDETDIYAIAEKLNAPEALFSGPLEFDSLNVGDLVCAEFPDDGSWYRAVVGKKFADGTLAVQFIDFGNEATIPCVKTCYLDKEFLAQPRFSIPCELGEIGNNQEWWDQEAISAFRSATVENPEKNYSCTFMKETLSVWDVVLEDQGIALAQTLKQKSQTGSNLKQTDCTEETSQYTKPDIIPNRPYQVYATCIVGPHFFWCQHDNSAALDKVSKLVEEAGRSGGQDPAWVETLSLGSPCLALFPDDSQWYRAQVLRRTGSTLSILFVDYGNEAEVDTSSVRAVPRFLFATAPQAFLCALEGFDESKGTWEECASDEFFELLVDKALSVTPLHVGENRHTAIPQYTVKVEVGETMVNKAMDNHWKFLGEKDGPPSLDMKI